MTSPAISPALIVHGGAGFFDDSRHVAAEEACKRATAEGLAVLKGGGSALDAVQAATRVLEDEPALNAGTGASLTLDGTVEVDAAIMDGATLKLGAVASLPNCGRAIDVARAILDDGRHALLCGEGAWRFARSLGFSPDDPETLIQEYRRVQLAEKKADGGGTVGAVAVDGSGQVAAATSTGGTTGKCPGRIGDTPLPGCGTYADELAAASATGYGEALMRILSTRYCVERCHGGVSPHAAALDMVREVESRIGGDAGVIIAHADGRLGAAHNTSEMPFAAGVVHGGRPHLLLHGIRIPEGLDVSEVISSFSGPT